MKGKFGFHEIWHVPPADVLLLEHSFTVVEYCRVNVKGWYAFAVPCLSESVSPANPRSLSFSGPPFTTPACCSSCSLT